LRNNYVLNVPIYIFAAGARGNSASIAKQITISPSNIRGGAYTPGSAYPRLASANIPITVGSNINGGIPDTINSTITVTPTISAARGLPMYVVITCQANGLGGNFPRYGEVYQIPVPISATVVGINGYLRTATLSKQIAISGTAEGILVPTGTINKPVSISISADGTSTAVESIYGTVIISCAATGSGQVPTGTVSKEITISSAASGLTGHRRGTINKPITIGITASGQVPIIGTIGQRFNNVGVEIAPPVYVIISGAPTNRARSFLSPGNPVPQEFRHGQISSEINISCSAQTADQVPLGYIAPEIEIIPDIRGRVVALTGTINAPVTIVAHAYDAIYGLAVPKATGHAVTGDVYKFGVKVAKTNVAAVIQQAQTGINIGKMVGYAVISGQTGVSQTTPYQAIMFF